MEIDSDYIHSGIQKLIRILDTENQYGSRVRVTDVYPEVQSVGVHSSQYNHLLPAYIQTLVIFFVRANFDLHKQNGMSPDTHHGGRKYM